jgi:uncharacterized protein YjbI with pentapeptide repeats
MPFYRRKKPVGATDHLEQVGLLLDDVAKWNTWRAEHPELRYVGIAGAKLRRADLAGANLRGAILRDADLYRADLEGADLSLADLREANLALANLEGAKFDLAECRANLFEANLRRADLRSANFNGATLRGAKFDGAIFGQTSFHGADLENAMLEGTDLTGLSLSNANLRRAKLARAKLTKAYLNESNLHLTDFREADLCGATLYSASLIETNFTGANLTGARIYGISAWNLKTDGARQENLVITPGDEPQVTVDEIAMAQFIYLLLNDSNLRHVIDTITSKVVLILGRFTEQRKAVLDGLRRALKKRDYTPVVFDFQKPAARDLTETIATLAGMARFVIADVTDAKSIPQELMAIVPHFPSVPVVPIILVSQREYGMFEHFRRYPWVLPLRSYEENEEVDSIAEAAIEAAEATRPVDRAAESRPQVV